MEPQTFKEAIIQKMDSIEQCIVERAHHEQELHNRLKRLSEIKLQIQECKIQEVKASDASSGEKDNSGIVSDKGNDKVEKVDSNVILDSPDMCNNDIQKDQHAEDERAALANLIANLKLDVEENKKIQKQLKKANTSLAHELKECKSILAETSKISRESNTIRDSCLIALQNKQTELETYKTLNDRTVDYDKLEHKLNETLGLLAQKEIDIKEGLVKEKTKVITDLKLKEEKDIDKMISMEKQLKFLNEIVYKRNQSIQTIHMLAPKGSTFNGRPTFANPMYLKKAQSEKPCLYEIPYDTSDPANRFVPDREETLTLEKESRSKLNKDLVKPYDYTKQNSLYENFKPASQEYHDQLAHANEYVESLEKEIVELDSDKADFSNIYDLLLQECVFNDVTFASQVGVSHDLTKPVTPHSWRQVRKSSFAKPYDVNGLGPSRNIPKHMSFQSPRKFVGSNDMVHNYYLAEVKKKAQLQKDKALNTKPSMQQSTRLPNITNGNRPKPRNFKQQPRNWPPSMSSRVSNRIVNIAEPPRNQKPFLNSKDLACPTCKKCIYNANHNECILKYLSKVHSRAFAQKKDAQSHKTTKRYMPGEKKFDSTKHDKQIPIGQKFSPNKSSVVYLKTMPPRSGLT
ncbi:hypothetical protein Tco_0317822 [Tanacetum coccineum]